MAPATTLELSECHYMLLPNLCNYTRNIGFKLQPVLSSDAHLGMQSRTI